MSDDEDELVGSEDQVPSPNGKVVDDEEYEEETYEEEDMHAEATGAGGDDAEEEELQDAEVEEDEGGDGVAAEEEIEEEDEARRGYQWYNRTAFYVPPSDGTTAGRVRDHNHVIWVEDGAALTATATAKGWPGVNEIHPMSIVVSKGRFNEGDELNDNPQKGPFTWGCRFGVLSKPDGDDKKIIRHMPKPLVTEFLRVMAKREEMRESSLITIYQPENDNARALPVHSNNFEKCPWIKSDATPVSRPKKVAATADAGGMPPPDKGVEDEEDPKTSLPVKTSTKASSSAGPSSASKSKTKEATAPSPAPAKKKEDAPPPSSGKSKAVSQTQLVPSKKKEDTAKPPVSAAPARKGGILEFAAQKSKTGTPQQSKQKSTARPSTTAAAPAPDAAAAVAASPAAGTPVLQRTFSCAPPVASAPSNKRSMEIDELAPDTDGVSFQAKRVRTGEVVDAAKTNVIWNGNTFYIIEH